MPDRNPTTVLRIRIRGKKLFSRIQHMSFVTIFSVKNSLTLCQLTPIFSILKKKLIIYNFVKFIATKKGN
jgi:hypothetical protein